MHAPVCSDIAGLPDEVEAKALPIGPDSDALIRASPVERTAPQSPSRFLANEAVSKIAMLRAAGPSEADRRLDPSGGLMSSSRQQCLDAEADREYLMGGKSNGPCWIRTSDRRIMSPLL